MFNTFFLLFNLIFFIICLSDILIVFFQNLEYFHDLFPFTKIISLGDAFSIAFFNGFKSVSNLKIILLPLKLEMISSLIFFDFHFWDYHLLHNLFTIIFCNFCH